MDNSSVRKSVFAGIIIGLAGWVNLHAGNPYGPFLFSFGLLGVCMMELLLYTGMAGRCNVDHKGIIKLLEILTCNVCGAFIIGMLSHCDPIAKTAANSIILDRNVSSGIGAVIKGIGCGILMELAVWCYIEKQTMAGIFVCVPAFIMGGMYHCIADAFYMAAGDISVLDGNFILTYLMTVTGNFIGCNLRRMLLR